MKQILLFGLLLVCARADFFCQCPEVRFILVDACTGSGNEPDNEFFVLDSGSGFEVDDLGFSTPTGTVTANSTNNNDFYSSNPCASCMTGCNMHFITNGDMVPANRHVVVFTSRNLNFMTYDLSGLCTEGEIYVLVANATPGSGQFANWSGANCSGCNPVSGDPLRTVEVTLAGGCSTEATYSRCLLRNMAGNCSAQDGGAVTFQNGLALYNNNGCFAPVLPVEFADFTVTRVVEAVRLDWTTLAELNNDYFTIQRSSDGFVFEDIGRVTGAGFSDVKKNYTFTDIYPVEGLQYYRVQQTDFDGKIGFSDVRTVRFYKGSLERITMISHDKIRIRGGDESFIVSVYNAGGMLMARLPDQKGEIEVDLDFLSRGVYMLVVQNHFHFETFRFFR